MVATRWIAGLLATGVLGGCGGTEIAAPEKATVKSKTPSASAKSVTRFFRSANGATSTVYVQGKPTLAEEGADAALVVTGEITGIGPGPFLAADPSIDFPGISTRNITMKVDQVVSGPAPGATVTFHIVSDSASTPTPPKGRVMVLLGKNTKNGEYVLGRPGSLLVETAGGLTAPLAEEAEDAYLKDVKKHKTFDEAGKMIKDGKPGKKTG